MFGMPRSRAVVLAALREDDLPSVTAWPQDDPTGSVHDGPMPVPGGGWMLPPEAMTNLQASFMSSLASRFLEVLPADFYPLGGPRTTRVAASRWIDEVLDRHPSARPDHDMVLRVARSGPRSTGASGPSGNL